MKKLLVFAAGTLAILFFPMYSAQAQDAAYVSPCKDLPEALKYQCRRYEAQSQIRAISIERNEELKELVRTNVGIAQAAQDKKKVYMLSTKIKTINDLQKHNEELNQILKDRSAEYREWYKEYLGFTVARRAMRTQTRMPSNMGLRLELMDMKGEYQNARKGNKVSRRTIINAQKRFVESYIPAQ